VRRGLACVALALLVWGGAAAQSGVCIVQTQDGCTVLIDFYSARFTAYQPDRFGQRKFCNELPGTGTTLFVLEYLHGSLKQVPVDFRIIHNVTGQGRFAGWEDVEPLGDLTPYTVFYQPPVIRPQDSLFVQHAFGTRGEYLAIVTAGHPSNGRTYRAVFPITIGATSLKYPLFGLLLVGFAALLYRRLRGR